MNTCSGLDYFNKNKQEDRIRKESRKMVLEVSELGQNEISGKTSHLHQHISKSKDLGEKQKNESQYALVRPYLPAPL